MTRTRVMGLMPGLALVVVSILGLGASAAPTSGQPAASGSNPPSDIIVKVSGDAANGFDIRYQDGTTLHPPTYSEAMAECSEYDTQVARVRCRTEVRIWYRDLADMKRAINWARR